ncbi:MAG: MaoC family dehydratase [Dehalococcoidales bacterium]|jgi:3-hydroxybutyryl-CoA dehydratase
MDILQKLGVEIGMKRSQTRTITAADIDTFADLSGDHNPVHMDEEYGKKTIFGGRIAHGVISLGLLSAAMAQLPGLPIFMSQSVRFLKPVRIGDTITASAEVIDMRPDKGIVTLKNTCTNQKGEVVIEGEAKCRLFERPA